MTQLSINKVKDDITKGWLNGFMGVLIFSGSLPATRIAITEMDPVFLTVARAAIAGILALVALLIYKDKRPTRKQIIPLAVVALGVVVGYPLLSALALQYVSAAHSMVFLGILPVSTAVFGIIRGGERPKPAFWVFSGIGSLLVIGYAISQGLTTSPTGDLLMLAGVLACGLGYAEGAKLSKSMGGLQVISWALVLSLPASLALSFVMMPLDLERISVNAWLGLGYVSVFSMFVGFIFWYKGLAQGGTVTISQLQLLQPFFGLALAATILHETVSPGMIAVTFGVILCVIGTRKFAKA